MGGGGGEWDIWDKVESVIYVESIKSSQSLLLLLISPTSSNITGSLASTYSSLFILPSLFLKLTMVSLCFIYIHPPSSVWLTISQVAKP